jgi:hypothetical protein
VFLTPKVVKSPEEANRILSEKRQTQPVPAPIPTPEQAAPGGEIRLYQVN